MDTYQLSNIFLSINQSTCSNSIIKCYIATIHKIMKIQPQNIHYIQDQQYFVSMTRNHRYWRNTAQHHTQTNTAIKR